MGIDTSIYNHLLRPPKSVAEYDAEAAQAQQNKLALQMGQAKMDEYQRGVADEQQMRGVVSKFGADKTANYNALLGAGRLKEAQAYEKASADNLRAQRDAEKAEIEGHFKKFELAGQIMNGVVDQASWDRARQQTAQVFGPEAAAQMPEVYDPKLIAQKQAQAMAVKDQLVQLWKAKEFDLDERKFGYQQTNDAANRGVQIRGQDVTANIAAAGRAQSERHFNENKAASKVPPGYRFKPDGSMEAIPGGPADLKNGAEAVKKVSEAKDVLGLLDEVDTLLPKATSGYVGAGVDAVAGAFGASTAGAQATAQLKAIEGALISKMPKMSGPQSDKDVLLYRQMAGQVGDSTIPTAQRQAAVSTIRKLNEKYAGMPEGSSKKSAGVFSDAEKERRYQEWKAKQGQK